MCACMRAGECVSVQKESEPDIKKEWGAETEIDIVVRQRQENKNIGEIKQTWPKGTEFNENLKLDTWLWILFVLVTHHWHKRY